MDPVTLGLLLSGGGQLASILGGRKAAKKKEQANREQQGIDAMLNLINVVGGRGTSGIRAAQPVAKPGLGEALQGAGGLVQAAGAQNRKMKLEDQAIERDAADRAIAQYHQRRKNLLDERAAKSLEELRAAQAAFNRGEGRQTATSGRNTLPSSISQYRF